MSQPFLGEIKLFAGNFAPVGYSFCQGQLLSIAQYSALFSLLGTTFGGDGRVTFGLPDLRSRIPIGAGTGAGLSPRSLGEQGGTESVTLTTTQIPPHTHTVACNTGAGNSATPAGSVWAANANTGQPQFAATPDTAMNPASIPQIGGNQPHSNIMPYLSMHFIIAIQGIYPSRN